MIICMTTYCFYINKYKQTTIQKKYIIFQEKKILKITTNKKNHKILRCTAF